MIKKENSIWFNISHTNNLSLCKKIYRQKQKLLVETTIKQSDMKSVLTKIKFWRRDHMCLNSIASHVLHTSKCIQMQHFHKILLKIFHILHICNNQEVHIHLCLLTPLSQKWATFSVSVLSFFISVHIRVDISLSSNSGYVHTTVFILVLI